MSILTKTLQLIIISNFFINVACAETPGSPVQKVKSTKKTNQNSLQLMSLVYEGKELFGATCKLSLSAIEHKTGTSHELEYVAKLGYKIHGLTPLDSVVSFHRYSLNKNKYFPLKSTQPDTHPALVSILLNDESKKVDVNKLKEYEQKGELVQFLRLDFLDVDIDIFEEAMEEVLTDNTKFKKNTAQLDQLQKSILKIAHGGHYDSLLCSNFKLKELKSTEYELEGDHEEGDHEEGDHEEGDHEEGDHDHDHDHGHEH